MAQIFQALILDFPFELVKACEETILVDNKVMMMVYIVVLNYKV